MTPNGPKPGGRRRRVYTVKAIINNFDASRSTEHYVNWRTVPLGFHNSDKSISTNHRDARFNIKVQKSFLLSIVAFENIPEDTVGKFS